MVQAYGADPQLQAIANLVIFAGRREDLAALPSGESGVIREILELQDKFDLYGKLAAPKRHNVMREAPEMYRLAADRHGVFVNVALTEPFGLTLLEAASCGLPIVATDQGGPLEIVGKLKNGILVNPHDTSAIQAALRSVLTDERQWRKFSNSGISNLLSHYSWKLHVERYLGVVNGVLEAVDDSIAKAA